MSLRKVILSMQITSTVKLADQTILHWLISSEASVPIFSSPGPVPILLPTYSNVDLVDEYPFASNPAMLIEGQMLFGNLEHKNSN